MLKRNRNLLLTSVGVKLLLSEEIKGEKSNRKMEYKQFLNGMKRFKRFACRLSFFSVLLFYPTY